MYCNLPQHLLQPITPYNDTYYDLAHPQLTTTITNYSNTPPLLFSIVLIPTPSTIDSILTYP